LAVVQKIKQWSYAHYTRVAVYLDRSIGYQVRRLPADEVHDKPPRVYLDLQKTRLDPRIASEIDINDGILKRARIAQNDRQRVRLVLDLHEQAQVDVVPFRDPFRLVIDVRHEREEKPKVIAKQQADDDILDDDALASLLAKATRRNADENVPDDRKPVVVIDAGHGGKDPGAVGHQGLQEKKIVLAIALKLADALEQQDVEVVLTRKRDVFLSLEERTIVANRERADLFVSIHANAAASPRAYGVETYHLAPAADERAAEVAARENAMQSTAGNDALEELLSALKLSSRLNISNVLATYLQERVAADLGRRYKPFRSIGVKGAPFYVLVGTEMAASLIEVGFVTNPNEAQRLRTRDYQHALAEAITRGIRKYLSKANKIPI